MAPAWDIYTNNQIQVFSNKVVHSVDMLKKYLE